MPENAAFVVSNPDPPGCRYHGGRRRDDDAESVAVPVFGVFGVRVIVTVIVKVPGAE